MSQIQEEQAHMLQSMLHTCYSSFGTSTTPTKAYCQINQNCFSINVRVVKTCFPHVEKCSIVCSPIRSCLGYFSFVYFKVFPFKSGDIEVLIELLINAIKISGEQSKVSLKTFDYLFSLQFTLVQQLLHVGTLSFFTCSSRMLIWLLNISRCFW